MEIFCATTGLILENVKQTQTIWCLIAVSHVEFVDETFKKMKLIESFTVNYIYVFKVKIISTPLTRKTFSRYLEKILEKSKDFTDTYSFLMKKDCHNVHTAIIQKLETLKTFFLSVVFLEIFR